MALERQLLGATTSVLLHAGLLAWAMARPPAHEPPVAMPVEVERIELVSLAGALLALEAAAGSTGPEPPRGEAATIAPEPEPEPQPEPKPKPHRPTPQRPEPQPEPNATSEPKVSPTSPDVEPEPAGPASSASASDHAAHAPTSGTRDGRGTSSSRGRMGTGESPDHSAYGAALVRRVMAEIDADPVPGLLPHDSIEVVLEVLPSGRLARHGLGKYDYAQVVHSSLGPLRLRAILRRILRASFDFPPHPSSFPRKRYVVGFTVRFRDLQG